MLFKPLNFFIGYILITLLISFFGPTLYENYNKIIVSIYIFFFLILFILGYWYGINSIERKKNSYVVFNKHEQLLKILKWCLILTISFQMIDIISLLSTNGFRMKSVGEAYLDVYSNYERNMNKSYSLIELIRFGSGIFEFITITLGLFYYANINNKWRIILLLSILLLLFSNLILQGKQKQLGDLVIIIASIGLIKIKSSRKYNTRMISGILMTMSLALVAFIYVQKSRFDAIGINVFNYNSVAQSQIDLNENHIIFDIFGLEWGFPISLLLSGYLSGGYYGLSLSLQLPFVWTYGLGSSYVWAVLAERLFNLPFFFENGYLFRMESEFGWPALSKWHTIFPWLASDFTFIGAIIIFSIIAFVYAVSWVEAFKYGNPISVLMFTLLNILLVFVPANNQLFMGIEQFFLSIILILLWLNRHRIFKKSNSVID